MRRDGGKQLIGIERPNLILEISKIYASVKTFTANQYFSSLGPSIDLRIRNHQRKYGSLVLDFMKELRLGTASSTGRVGFLNIAMGTGPGRFYFMSSIIS